MTMKSVNRTERICVTLQFWKPLARPLSELLSHSAKVSIMANAFFCSLSREHLFNNWGGIAGLSTFMGGGQHSSSLSLFLKAYMHRGWPTFTDIAGLDSISCDLPPVPGSLARLYFFPFLHSLPLCIVLPIPTPFIYVHSNIQNVHEEIGTFHLHKHCVSQVQGLSVFFVHFFPDERAR